MRRRSSRVSSAAGHRARDDVALDALHDVEGRADDRLVVADREHRGHARAAGERRQHARLAQHVVGAGRQRAARRAAQHDVGAVAAQGVGDVGVALADGLDLERRRRPGRARRGRPSAGRGRAAARARWPRPRRGCGRRRPGPPGCSPPETLVLPCRARRQRPILHRTTTFAGLQAVPGAVPILMRRSSTLIATVCALAALLAPAAAQASHSQSLTFEAPRDLKNPATRDAGLRRHRVARRALACASSSTGTTSRRERRLAHQAEVRRDRSRRLRLERATTPVVDAASRRAGGSCC